MNPRRLDPGLARPDGSFSSDPDPGGPGDRVHPVVEATGRELVRRPSMRPSRTGTPGPVAGPNGAPSHGVVVPGDDEDLAAAYRRLYPSLVRTAYLLVDTREQAEEVVQEAFAKAFPKWDRLRVPEAYVRTCVVNGCRRVQRRRTLLRRMPGPAVDPAARAEHDHIADVVRRLPSPQREAVVLRYYLQATDAEIAATLKIAVGTVKSSLHRARAHLRRELLDDREGQ